MNDKKSSLIATKCVQVTNHLQASQSESKSAKYYSVVRYILSEDIESARNDMSRLLDLVGQKE